MITRPKQTTLFRAPKKLVIHLSTGDLNWLLKEKRELSNKDQPQMIKRKRKLTCEAEDVYTIAIQGNGIHHLKKQKLELEIEKQIHGNSTLRAEKAEGTNELLSSVRKPYLLIYMYFLG